MAAPPKIICVASGKGGVGKTNVTLNLAWALARLGRRVCILDADLGLSNIDVLLGLTPERTLEQVLFEGMALERALLPVATGIDLIPGSSGVARMAELSRAARVQLVREFSALERYDFILVDNSPGISAQVLALCLAAQELVLVVNPEITSLTDAYALIKVLHGRGLSWPPLVLVNRAPGAQAADLVFRRIQATAQKHLRLNCTFLGFLPEDASVAKASALQRPVLEAFPQSAFARAVAQAAERLAGAARLSLARAVAPAEFWDESVRALLQTMPPAPQATGLLAEVEAMRALFARLDFKGAPEPLRRIAEAGQGHAKRLRQALEPRLAGAGQAPGTAPVATKPAAPVATKPAAPAPEMAVPVTPAVAIPAAAVPAPASRAPIIRAQGAAPSRAATQRSWQRRPEKSQPAKHSAPTPAPTSARQTVLVRTANRDMSQIVADILREMRLDPVVNGGGSAGLCVLAAAEPTPHVAAYLKSLPGVPVLVLDESFGRSRAAWQAQPGVRAVLPVPFDVPEFIRSVTGLLTP